VHQDFFHKMNAEFGFTLDAATTAKDGDQRFDGTKTGPDRARVGASVQGPSDRVNDEARL
jgi:hypothetical protein